MYYLKNQKKLIEITQEQAEQMAMLIDKNKPISLGYERLNPYKCEIIKGLPFDYQDFEIIEQVGKIGTAENSGNFKEEINKAGGLRKYLTENQIIRIDDEKEIILNPSAYDTIIKKWAKYD